jgi:hypothetical protein
MKGLEKHNLDDKDKSGYPINNQGQHVTITDADGNCVILIPSYLLKSYPQGFGVKFNPFKSLEVNNALDALVNILTEDFENIIKGELTIDLTAETKKKHNVYTKQPLVVHTVLIYFTSIENFLKYVGNCYDVSFKARFYVKFKNRAKQYLLPLETNLNSNSDVKKSCLKYCKKWFKTTDKAIGIEQNTKNTSFNKDNELLQHKNIIAVKLAGDNKTNTLSVTYDHINDVLKYYNLTHSEARQILLDMMGTFNPMRIKNIIEPIIRYLERSNAEAEPHRTPNQFSVLEWSTIYYYADVTNLLPSENNTKERIEYFMKKHNVPTTFKSFKSKYYHAKKRINKENNYPISKLEKIIPFLEINYSQTVTKVENDIVIIEEENAEYQ